MVSDMKFEVFQIIVSEDVYDEVNLIGHAAAAANHGEYKAHLDATIGKYLPSNRSYYTQVATIEADSLEGAFRIGNIGPEKAITRIAKMHSVSVGDIVRDVTEGTTWFCESFGWREISAYENVEC